MKSLLVQGEVPAPDLLGLFSAIGAQVQGSAAYAFGTTRIFLGFGSKYYFRTSDYIGIVLFAATDGASQRIDVSYVGGGSGVFGVQMGAGSDLENSLSDAVISLLSERSLQYTDVSAPVSG
jgi:hypothetical protein